MATNETPDTASSPLPALPEGPLKELFADCKEQFDTLKDTTKGKGQIESRAQSISDKFDQWLDGSRISLASTTSSSSKKLRVFLGTKQASSEQICRLLQDLSTEIKEGKESYIPLQKCLISLCANEENSTKQLSSSQTLPPTRLNCTLVWDSEIPALKTSRSLLVVARRTRPSPFSVEFEKVIPRIVRVIRLCSRQK